MKVQTEINRMITEAVELPKDNLRAEVNFETREDADEFAEQWSRKTLMGHTVDKSSVYVYNVTTETKEWINSYISTKNELKCILNKDPLGLLG